MDFANHHIQRMNRERHVNNNPLKQFPKKELSELERINDQMIESLRVRMQNLLRVIILIRVFEKW